MTVVLGSSLLFSGGTRFETMDFVLNPGYNPNIAANDLAVIRTPRITFSSEYLFKILTVCKRFISTTIILILSEKNIKKLKISVLIQPVALPSGSEVNMDFVGFQATVSGYGVTRHGKHNSFSNFLNF